MRRSRYDRDIDLFETILYIANIDLFKLTIADVFLLVDDASTCSCDRCGRERSGKNETGGVGPDHVDEIVGASNVTANGTVCLAKSAYKKKINCDPTIMTKMGTYQ